MKMQRSKKRIIMAAASAVIAHAWFSAFTVEGAVTWDGGGADDNLNTAANWVGDVNPLTTDDVVFTGLTRTTPVVNAALQYKSITFDLAASAFTIGGANALVTGASPSTAGNIT